MERLKNFFKLMLGPELFWKNVGFTLFMLVAFFFVLFNRAGWEEWEFLYYAPSKWYYYPLYLPPFLILFWWIGRFIQLKKGGQI